MVGLTVKGMPVNERCDRARNCVLMSNFDHIVDQEVLGKLQSGEIQFASYPAWNFAGTVYLDDGNFLCDIWINHKYIHTIEASSAEEIMRIASETYGGD